MKGSKELALILIASAGSYDGSLFRVCHSAGRRHPHRAGLADRVLWGFIALSSRSRRGQPLSPRILK